MLASVLGSAGARALERGTFAGPVARALSEMWAWAGDSAVTRSLAAPEHVRVVCVGGSTLGGSGKTPIAIACAIELARSGARTALVGHAYRAHPGRPRVVAPCVGHSSTPGQETSDPRAFAEASDPRAFDEASDVGDEALLAARALRPFGASVVVAPRRADALAFASERFDVLVLDGVSQLRPKRADLALLAVDGPEPWGKTIAPPPAGDLRARRDVLLRACDAVVPVFGEPSPQAVSSPFAPAWWPARAHARGARLASGALLSWTDLQAMRVGLFTALARPDRILRALASHGVYPCVHVCAPDHGPLPKSPPRSLARRLPVDLWLATAKCALHATGAKTRAGARLPYGEPLGTLEYTLELSTALRDRLRAVALS